MKVPSNAIRAQALLLCESIRRFGGRHRSAPILAVAPRPGLGNWGSNQAAAALAIWSRTKRLVIEHPELRTRPRTLPLVHVHYHWLFTDPHHEVALAALRELGVAPDRLEWLTARLPLR